MTAAEADRLEVGQRIWVRVYVQRRGIFEVGVVHRVERVGETLRMVFWAPVDTPCQEEVRSCLSDFMYACEACALEEAEEEARRVQRAVQQWRQGWEQRQATVGGERRMAAEAWLRDHEGVEPGDWAGWLAVGADTPDEDLAAVADDAAWCAAQDGIVLVGMDVLVDRLRAEERADAAERVRDGAR
jgi:hypothetical protein